MRTETASAETADHTQMHTHTRLMTQVFGPELGFSAEGQKNSFLGGDKISFMMKPILVSLNCLVKK